MGHLAAPPARRAVLPVTAVRAFAAIDPHRGETDRDRRRQILARSRSCIAPRRAARASP